MLKLTIQAVAKMTGLRESTVRQYAWQKKLGKLEGRTRVFTLAEAKKLGGLASGSQGRRGRKKSATTKRAARTKENKQTQPARTKDLPAAERKRPWKESRSFWTFLGFGRKPKAKVGLMQAGIKK